MGPIKVIFNPAAAPHRSQENRQQILNYLDTHAIEFDWSETLHHSHAEELAREAADNGFSRIAVAGGDGTINQVVNGLVGSSADPEVVILPVGTCNDFIRSVPLPTELPQALTALKGSRIRRVDLARIGGRYFINAAGIGFDVNVIENLGPNGKRNYINYLLSVFKNLFGFQAIHLTIHNNGDVSRKKVILFVAANGRQFGGGFKIAPHASLEDGQLNFMLFQDMPGWKRLRALIFFMQGKHHLLPETEIFCANALHVESAVSLRLQMEGELYDWSEPTLEISVIPRRIPIVLADS
ncbi:diacylglycerol kinase family lipid kinase [candidate division KSB1 bacterium]|nr:diacylglycerol kinase family lipid kinase [candidate division KSB1 bacterium]